MKRIQIVPAILTKSSDEFTEKLHFLTRYFKLIQIDVMDGKFVRQKSFYDFDFIKNIRTSAEYELHLMAKNPKSIVSKWFRFKKLKRVIVHYESFSGQKQIRDIIKLLKSKGVKVAISINPETNLENIHTFSNELDMLLIMGVTPGKSGQAFIKDVHPKIIKARYLYPTLDIEVDGGVNEDNVDRIIRDGANIIASASMIFKAKNLPQLINRIKATKKNY